MTAIVLMLADSAESEGLVYFGPVNRYHGAGTPLGEFSVNWGWMADVMLDAAPSVVDAVEEVAGEQDDPAPSWLICDRRAPPRVKVSGSICSACRRRPRRQG